MDLDDFLIGRVNLGRRRYAHALDILFALLPLILPPLDERRLLSECVQLLLHTAPHLLLDLHAVVDDGDISLKRVLFPLCIHTCTHFARLFITMHAQRLIQSILFLHETPVLLYERRHLILPPLGIETAELHGLFRLRGERLKLCRMRVHDIIQTYEVTLVLTQLAQSLLLARAVLCDASSFLKEYAAVFGAAVEDIVQSVLSDDAHAVMSDARIRKELVDVLNTAARIIEIHLAVAVAV